MIFDRPGVVVDIDTAQDVQARMLIISMMLYTSRDTETRVGTVGMFPFL